MQAKLPPFPIRLLQLQLKWVMGRVVLSWDGAVVSAGGRACQPDTQMELGCPAGPF